MPTPIEAMPKSSRGRTKKYDFSAQYDGGKWLLVQGEDFDCEVPSIRQVIYREVRELNKTVHTAETESNGKKALALQVTDEPPKDTKADANGAGDAAKVEAPKSEAKPATPRAESSGKSAPARKS